MQRVVVAVRRRSDAVETDFEVPSDLAASELAERLARSLGTPPGSGPLELQAQTLGRPLRPQETLAHAGLWDGAKLVLARATDPVDAGAEAGKSVTVANAPGSIDPGVANAPGAGLEPGLAQAPTGLANTPMGLDTRVANTPLPMPPPPPILPRRAFEPPPARPIVPLVALGVLLLALIGGGVFWFVRGRESGATVAPTASAPLAGEPTPGPTPLLIAPNVQPTLATPAPVAVAVATTADDEAAWRDMLARLDGVWGLDWPASISLLQTFHAQNPTRTAATDKLYAALIEYGRALRDAGATAAATDAFDQAVRLQPQRFEAREELAATAPPGSPAAGVPLPVAAAPPAEAPTLVALRPTAPAVVPAPPPTAMPVVAAPVPPAAPEPGAEPPSPAVCDVRSSESACPLADGSHVQELIDVPDGRHFYWFGVTVPGLQLHVEANGPACPCTLFVFSDQVDSGNTPIALGIGSLERAMHDAGPYVLEVAPSQSGGGGGSDGLYTLAIGLQLPPPPVVARVEDPASPPPTPTAVPVPIAVPPVVARTPGEASDRLRALGLVPQTQAIDRFSAGGAGTVAAQDPPAGAAVPPGSRVTLLIASGNVPVPPVVGLFEQEAWQVLHNQGFDIAVRHLRRSGVEAGRAASVDPPAGAVVPIGTTVNLTISQGD